MKTEFHISLNASAAIVSLVYIGADVGSLILGRFADKLGNRSLVMMFSSLLGAISSLILIYVPMDIMLTRVVVFFIGFSTASYTVGYALARDLCPKDIFGTVSGYINTGILNLQSSMRHSEAVILNYASNL